MGGLHIGGVQRDILGLADSPFLLLPLASEAFIPTFFLTFLVHLLPSFLDTLILPFLLYTRVLGRRRGYSAGFFGQQETSHRDGGHSLLYEDYLDLFFFYNWGFGPGLSSR